MTNRENYHHQPYKTLQVWTLSVPKINLLAVLVTSIFFVAGCESEPDVSSYHPMNWSAHAYTAPLSDSLEYGKSYLSIYSEIYSYNRKRTQSLTAMASIRNISDSDTIFILKAEYLDSHGKTVRNFFEAPIFLAPMETTEIIIDETDITGGTGSNFIFEWKIPEGCPQPLFEGIMTSTLGQQGLSFTTQAVRIK